MADFANEKIYERLQLEFRNKKELTKAVVVKARDLRSFIDPSELQNQFNKIEAIMHLRIGDGYDLSKEEQIKVAAAAAEALIDKYGSKASHSDVQTPREIRQLRVAFTETKYVGNAHVKFAQYLRRCYNLYGSSDFKTPSVEGAQSSGFGKSRMIRELAVKAKDDQELNMKVLYTCIRMRNSTGYPKATPELIDWLFKKGSTVEVAKALEETLKHEEAKATDKSASRKKKASDKLVLVVIDEARHLVDNTTSGLDHFHLLLRALVSVNNSIGKEGAIFGVLVDTNPRMTPPDPLPPPHKVDPSSRGSYFSRNLPSLPSFVLTHTIDACWQQYCRDQLEDVKGVLMDTRNSDD